MQRLLGYSVAALGAALTICSAHHSSEMHDIERMAQVGVDIAYSNNVSNRIDNDALQMTTRGFTAIKSRALEQWYTGLKGMLAGAILVPIGFGITRLPFKPYSPQQPQ